MLGREADVAKQLTPFGQSKTDAVVMAHLTEIGVDPGIVMGYEIARSPGTTRLTLELWFNDTPAEHPAPAH